MLFNQYKRFSKKRKQKLLLGIKKVIDKAIEINEASDININFNTTEFSEYGLPCVISSTKGTFEIYLSGTFREKRKKKKGVK